MFERRLKICLGILLSVMSVLLLRAFHLQVITRGAWVQAADEFKNKAQFIETTRGRILDVKGHELAVDDAAMDVCVDDRAISRDPDWIQKIALKRAIDAVTATEWNHMPKPKHEALVASAEAQVKDEIDKMFVLIARETGRDQEQIDEFCHKIDIRVSLSRRRKQYERFEEAQSEQEAKGSQTWYERWLADNGKEGPDVDDYDQPQSVESTVYPLVRNISSDAYLNLARQIAQCPGMELRAGTHRRYPYGKAACHLLGTVATAKDEDFQTDPYKGINPLLAYEPNDTVGRGGIEALGEPTLRGVRGKGYKAAGADDQLQVVSEPVPGKDVKTTIDIELQDQIQKMFEHMKVRSNKADDPRSVEVAMHGAAVVIDIKTSAVRALASYPDYDPNTLSDNYDALVTDATLDAPLLNRATQSQLEPGSTLKPVVGISAITQGLKVPDYGVMTIKTGIHCTGFLVLHGHKMPNGRCWVASRYFDLLGGAVANHPIPPYAPHRGVYGNPDGYLCFADALERSCNVYFETLGDAFGVASLSYWYDHFGLGRETGIGIPEARGFLPIQDPSHDPSIAWFSGIGQVGVRVTPLQMANVAATIARDGIWMRPRLVEDGCALKPYVLKDGREAPPDQVDLKLSKEALAAARDGMVRVVNSPGGTGKDNHMDELLVAGKTGTAQAAEIKDPVRDADGKLARDAKNKPISVPRDPASIDHPTSTPWYRGWGEDGKSLNHAWFIGFAPADHPQVAFAVMVQYGGSGGILAGQTAKSILTACIEHGYIDAARH